MSYILRTSDGSAYVLHIVPTNVYVSSVDVSVPLRNVPDLRCTNLSEIPTSLFFRTVVPSFRIHIVRLRFPWIWNGTNRPASSSYARSGTGHIGCFRCYTCHNAYIVCCRVMPWNDTDRQRSAQEESCLHLSYIYIAIATTPCLTAWPP